MNDIKNNFEETRNHKPVQPPSPNLFQGRTEGEKGNVKFPNWDIIPPNQIINPRTRNQ